MKYNEFIDNNKHYLYNSSDSVVTFFWSDSVPMLRRYIGPGYSYPGRPIKNKEDSAKYKWNIHKEWKGYSK